MDHGHHLLKDIGLSLIFAGVAAHLARLLRQPIILGYVIGGILLGDHIGFGLVSDAASVELISEIGLIFLLFIIGLEINVRELAASGKSLIVLGVTQFLICVGLGLAGFRAAGYSMGGGNFDLLYLAVALALSSTLIVVKLLHDKFEVFTPSGRLTIGVLVFQDLWAIGFMAVQPNLADPQVGVLLKSLLLGLGLLAAAFAASRYALSRAVHAVARTPELVLLSAVGWCFLVCGLAQKAGLSKEMGALIAGMSIAAYPYGADVTSKIAGVRDFFVTLFFVSLGLKVPAPTAALLAQAAGVSAFVVASRLAAVVPAALATGQSARIGAVTAINLSQISEFSLVILALGAGYGHVSGGLQTLVLVSMLMTAVLSTYLIKYSDRLARGVVRALHALGLRDGGERAAGGAHPRERDLVLLGCFREGLALLDAIEAARPELKQRVLVVDYNPALRAQLEPRGYKWVYGDLAHPESLHHAGIEHASLVVCSVSDTFLKGITNYKLLQQLKRLAPEAKFIMTADVPSQVQRLHEAGAFSVVVPGKLAGEHIFSLVEQAGAVAA